MKRTCLRIGLVILATACSSATTPSGPSTGSPDAGNPAPPAAHAPAPVTVVDGYPVGPYGMDEGSVFPNLTLEGYRSGAGDWTSIALKDYFDPDGTRGIAGLYLTGSAPWCEACVLEGKSFPAEYASAYKAKGARFLTALLQDNAKKPATRATVDDWIAAFHTNYDIAADGAITVLARDANGAGMAALPYNYVINPRTMRVVHINAGPFFTGGTIVGLDDLLKKNAPH